MLAMTKACFDGALMVFSPWWPNQVPQTVRFRRAKFWVRICGLPCEYLNSHMEETIGEMLGMPFELDDDAIIWIQLRYENLFKYCTRCGRIGHKYTRCTRHEDLIKIDIDHKMMEYLSRGIPTMETEEGFLMFTLDLRATPSSERTITTRVRLVDELVRPPSPNFRALDILVDFDLGI
uniref:Zinc knuckle CX2CX4HX4C domain-containing protein n=1 Tax=Chenopodium quinoa TaxID=63459 RepID=A0A803MHW7_CHEQI